jgi:hypothetical protein
VPVGERECVLVVQLWEGAFVQISWIIGSDISEPRWHGGQLLQWAIVEVVLRVLGEGDAPRRHDAVYGAQEWTASRHEMSFPLLLPVLAVCSGKA